MQDHNPPEGLVTYIPLHPSREQSRGYNQSYLLAREFSRAMGLPLSNTLQRIKNTKPQASLSRQDRRENVQGMFAPIEEKYTDLPLLLVDDVLTTGATMEEAVKTLKDSGQVRIVGILAAVQPPLSFS